MGRDAMISTTWKTFNDLVMLLSMAPKLHCCKLKSGGYRCLEDWSVNTGILDRAGMVHGWEGKLLIELDNAGLLTMKKGYWWDGCSFIVIDRETNMRAGGLHDELYHLCRTGDLDVDEIRQPADLMFRAFHRVDGGWNWIGAIDYAGLRIGARSAATRQPEIEAEHLVFGRTSA